MAFRKTALEGIMDFIGMGDLIDRYAFWSSWRALFRFGRARCQRNRKNVIDTLNAWQVAVQPSGRITDILATEVEPPKRVASRRPALRELCDGK